jgi:hypothetical protein
VLTPSNGAATTPEPAPLSARDPRPTDGRGDRYGEPNDERRPDHELRPNDTRDRRGRHTSADRVASLVIDRSGHDHVVDTGELSPERTDGHANGPVRCVVARVSREGLDAHRAVRTVDLDSRMYARSRGGPLVLDRALAGLGQRYLSAGRRDPGEPIDVVLVSAIGCQPQARPAVSPAMAMATATDAHCRRTRGRGSGRVQTSRSRHDGLTAGLSGRASKPHPPATSPSEPRGPGSCSSGERDPSRFRGRDQSTRTGRGCP